MRDTAGRKALKGRVAEWTVLSTAYVMSLITQLVVSAVDDVTTMKTKDQSVALTVLPTPRLVDCVWSPVDNSRSSRSPTMKSAQVCTKTAGSKYHEVPHHRHRHQEQVLTGACLHDMHACLARRHTENRPPGQWLQVLHTFSLAFQCRLASSVRRH